MVESEYKEESMKKLKESEEQLIILKMLKFYLIIIENIWDYYFLNFKICLKLKIFI